MIRLFCAVPGCDFDQDPGTANLVQYHALVNHLRESHFAHAHRSKHMGNLTKNNMIIGADGTVGHPSPASPSTREEIWAELISYVAQAIEFPPFNGPEGDPWADGNAQRIAELEHELEKARLTAAGRGIAEAIVIIYGQYQTADDAIREAVARYRANQQVHAAVSEAAAEVVSALDPTPAAPASEPAPSAPVAAPTPSPAPAPAIASADTTTPVAVPEHSLGTAPVTVGDMPVVEEVPIQSRGEGLARFTEEEKDKIRAALEVFDGPVIADMFKLTAEEVESLR
ncbi:hypothetical protein Mbo2_076 [Rhodococcus phage Mbo2]|uniref:Uncharacterized protein n=1 Tax=Rhodococcus phage Mbo2 TaxID=2936911 RepID=A0A9E7IPN3_9CAUD|nr:hypothetical protein Mbo2_076 [Rhodococcus phage Mbo2]